MMIHLKPLIIIYLFLYNYAQAHECIFKTAIKCIFNGVRTSKSNLYFNPTASNHSAVTSNNFVRSVMPILTNELCKAFPNLIRLALPSLSMEQIMPNALHECKKITSIYFFNNNLQKLDPNVFEGSIELDFINLQVNHFTDIDGRVFASVPKLEQLILGENLLTELRLDTFPKMEKLQHIDISVNDLTDFDEHELLRKFPDLRSITMHNNLFDCGRLRNIIDVLHKNKVQLEEFERSEQTRNANLTTVENVECVSSYISDLVKVQVDELEEKAFYMMVTIGVLFVLHILLLVIGLIMWKSQKRASNPINQIRLNPIRIDPAADYYYEDTGFPQETDGALSGCVPGSCKS